MATSGAVHAGQAPPEYGYAVFPRNGGETLNWPTSGPRPPTPRNSRSPVVPALERRMSRSVLAPTGRAPTPRAPGATPSGRRPPDASSTRFDDRGLSLV